MNTGTSVDTQASPRSLAGTLTCLETVTGAALYLKGVGHVGGEDRLVDLHLRSTQLLESRQKVDVGWNERGDGLGDVEAAALRLLREADDGVGPCNQVEACNSKHVFCVSVLGKALVQRDTLQLQKDCCLQQPQCMRLASAATLIDHCTLLLASSAC